MLAMARRTTMRAAAHLRGLALPLVVATAYRRSLGTGAAGDAPFDDGRGHKDAGALPLALIGELTYLPDSAKLQRGSQGEDAYFVSTYAVGVADGVGGWSEVGVDAGKYSRGLMNRTRAWVDARVDAAAGGAVDVDPLDALDAGYRATTEQGSSTACVATVSSAGLLRVRNLGDSGLMLYRHERSLSLVPNKALRLDEAEKLWTPLLRTDEQEHEFNFPLQLEAAERSDKPQQAQALEFWALPGDLLLLATDGFLDNMWPADTRRALAKVDWTPCAHYVRLLRARVGEEQAAAAAEDGAAPAAWQPYRPAGHSQPVTPAELAAAEKACRAVLLSVSAALAVGAQRVGMDRHAQSPFAAAALASGRRWTGGKPDDVVVLAALAVPDVTRARLAGRRNAAAAAAAGPAAA